MKVFLTAEWRKLLVINYEIDPAILAELTPSGTELDAFGEKHYVSLVGFMFLNTKVMGLRIPFHVNFEEVNLRFYVKRNCGGELRRGVVFIKEIVPRAMISITANVLYGEKYESAEMLHFWNHDENENEIEVQYSWMKGEMNSISCIADSNQREIISGTKEDFILEHYWGYTKKNVRATMEYEVRHPKWMTYKVKQYFVKVDFADVYGSKFGFLYDASPASVFLAEGSDVRVYKGKKITFSS